MSTPETTEGVGEIHNRLGPNTTNAATAARELSFRVQIGRHCERQHGTIYDLAATPEDNFDAKKPYKSCTNVGIEHQRANGVQMKDELRK